jgi:hypothetical protein
LEILAQMNYRILFTVCTLLLLAPAVWSQTARTDPPYTEEQNETMRDTLKRMQIRREEDEHKKLIEKGSQIIEEAKALAKESSLSGGQRLPRTAEKKIKEIEKFARQIRSDSGGSQDEPLDTPPSSLAETLEQLLATSERLNENLGKTSRRVVSIAVVDCATEVIQLAKILRTYLN